jgi:hypothetical protein
MVTFQTQEVDLSNWTIERVHPKGTAQFKIPQGTKIGADKEIKVRKIEVSCLPSTNEKFIII